MRAGVLSGAYRLAEAPAGLDRWRCVIASCGALLPEALRARDLLADEGIGAAVVNVTSSDLVFRHFRARTLPPIVTPDEVGRPLITAHDAAPQHLAFLAAALGMALVPLGVDRFGQCGSQPAVYGWLGISGEAIAESAIGAFAR